MALRNFCLAIHPLLKLLRFELRIRFPDDLTMAGSQAVIAKDIALVAEEAGSLGLSVNSRHGQM